jgi:gamma-glutamyl-gamma-aminobutyrate hydrolase PuuD/uncharacterized protein YjbI with pentapeptide repeats
MSIIAVNLHNRNDFKNCCSSELNQERFDSLLKEFVKEKVVSNNNDGFGLFLFKKGYNDVVLKNIKFNIVGLTVKEYDNGRWVGKVPFHSTDVLTKTDFSGISFENCDFSYVNLKGSCFSKCKFINCNFSYSCLKSCSFIDCGFTQCSFNEAIFNCSMINNSIFVDSDLSGSSFHYTKLDKVRLKHSKLSSVSFWGASVSQSSITCQSREQLQDCLFFGNQKDFGVPFPPSIQKPVIGFIWNSEKVGYTGNKHYLHLKKLDCIVLKIDCCEDEDMSLLEKEVEEKVKKNSGIKAQRLFKNFEEKYPRLNRLNAYAKQLAENIDGLVLSGGNDIYPIFSEVKDHVETDKSYFRDVLELSLLHHSVNRGIPIQGICRGSQITNIYFGGTNKTLEKKQKGVIKLNPSELNIYGCKLPKKFSAFVNHHQASSYIAEDLSTVVTTRDPSNIPYLLSSKRGSPILLSQFHPEVKTDIYSEEEMKREYPMTHLSSVNETFASIIVEMSKTYHKKKNLSPLIHQRSQLRTRK